MGRKICHGFGIGGEILSNFSNFGGIEFEKVLVESGKKIKGKCEKIWEFKWKLDGKCEKSKVIVERFLENSSGISEWVVQWLVSTAQL